MVAKIDRIGEKRTNNQGLEMKIVKYRNAGDIDVKFILDGYVKKRVKYEHFKKGNIKNDNLENRLDEINYNKFGSKMIIKEYRNSLDVDIYFPEYDWIAKNVQYSNFKNGKIKCPYERSICNVGYLGEGEYKATENGEITRVYNTWNNMLQRCYSEKLHRRESTYENCRASEEWLNFQNFGEWDEDNYYEVEGEKMCLDKDILIKGNKIYSPDTCIYVPQTINTLFVKCNKSRGNYPIGTYLYRNGKYVAQCCLINPKTGKSKIKHLGYYTTQQEAFKVYKQFKERNIKEVADYYKSKIPTKLYDALYNCEIEITD